MLGTDDNIILKSTNVELLGYMLGYAVGITLSIDEQNVLGYPYGYFDGFNDVVPEISLLGESLRSDDGTALGYFYFDIDGVVEKSSLYYHLDILMVSCLEPMMSSY